MWVLHPPPPPPAQLAYLLLTWQEETDEWLLYLKLDVLSTAPNFARYSMNLEQSNGFRMKDCFSLPSRGWKKNKSKRTQDDELIYIIT